MNHTITWHGHAYFEIKVHDKCILIDPFKVTDKKSADIILITHSHFDHCSIKDIQKVMTKKTIILATPDTETTLSTLGVEVVYVEPRKTYTICDVQIETVRAYNINKKFHPISESWVGYIINTEFGRIYHAGDTDLIPEMNTIEADIALLPVSGTYVMTPSEAAQAAHILQPKLVIPMHFASIVGTEQDAERFKLKCGSIPVEILTAQ